MLFIILLFASVLGTIVLTANTTKNNVLTEFCKLECKRDVTKNYKFCC
jgi:hypothetical protein